MKTKAPSCTDCSHHAFVNGWAICNLTGNGLERRSCVHARNRGQACGPSAKLFWDRHTRGVEKLKATKSTRKPRKKAA